MTPPLSPTPTWRQLVRPRGAQEMTRAVCYWLAFTAMGAFAVWFVVGMLTGER